MPKGQKSRPRRRKPAAGSSRKRSTGAGPVGGIAPSVFRSEFIDTLALLAQACDDMVRKGYERPVLVGGGAVEFHTGSVVVSGDFGFVTEEMQAFGEALAACGFKREDRPRRLLIGWYHPELAMRVQVVSGDLFDGNSDRRRVQLVDIIDGKAVAIAPIEDLIADRLEQHASTETGMPDRLDQAVKLFRLADHPDEAYLDRRIRQESGGTFDLAYLKDRCGDSDHP